MITSSYALKRTIMKNILILLFVFTFSGLFGQQQTYTSVIPRDYKEAGTFALISNKMDTIITFCRKGKINTIETDENNYLLKKRKILINSARDTIAFYKGKKILFPSKNKVVKERKNKDGWAYYLDNQKILDVTYQYNKNKRTYQITAKFDEFDELVTTILQLSLGRFDKRVVMDYDDSDFSTEVIIAIIVSSS